MALRKKLEDFARALDRLEEAYRKTEDYREDELYSFLRDSTIQRFEFSLGVYIGLHNAQCAPLG